MRFNLFVLSFFFLNAGISQIDILNTDFQTGIPVTYTILDNDGRTPASAVSEFTSAWIIKQDPLNTLDSVAASTSYFEPVGEASRWLITPPLSLGNYGNFIEWEARSHDASYPDDYLILVSSTDAQISSFTDTVGYIIEEYADWTSREVDLSSHGYANQTIYVAFVNVTDDGFKLYLDDIHAWIEDPVGISELSANTKLNVFPNPSNGKFTVNCDEEIKTIGVYSLTNQLVLSTSENTVDLSSNPAGVYLIKIETINGFYSSRIILN